MTIVTAIVCETLMEPANHVEVMLGKAPALNTFSFADRTNGDTNFAVSSGEWTEAQIAGVQSPNIIDALQYAGRMPEIVDIDMARQAQAATRVVFLDAEPILDAQAGKIFLLVGDEPEPAQVLAAAGLSNIDPE